MKVDQQYAGDLYGEMLLAEEQRSNAPAARKTYFPGVVICVIASIAAAWLSENYGAPIILMGLLIGLALNFVAADPRTHDGLDFASKTCLRWGIVVLGTQVTFTQIGTLGVVPFVALAVVMAMTMAAGIIMARIIGQPFEAGLLAGGATAICGASAALALYGVIGKDRLSQAQFALTLVSISLASAAALTVYPILASALNFSDQQAGFLIGASTHDVAQAIGGGYAFSDSAGSYATIVKLSRVALLAPVVAIVSIVLARRAATASAGKISTLARFRQLALPWFIIAFLLVVCANSLITLPKLVGDWTLVTSKGLLLLAVTATAMRSRVDLIMQMGWRAAMPVLAATLTSLMAAIGFSVLLLV